MKASVFIVESLTFSDEKAKRREGRILTDILHLSGKPAEYVYIRTRRELEAVLRRFSRSGMRYLHVSCHGTKDALSTTLDNIPFADFSRLVRPYIRGRRVFLSACEASNRKLAQQIIPGSGCYSLIGPVGDIYFADAAIIWASFYHLMFKRNPEAMKRPVIREILSTICNTFGVSMRYFGSSERSPFYTDRVFRPHALS